jgi:thiamine-monophosphate kinase
MTKLSTIGEFGLINRISKNFTQGLPPEITGIGDDCAIIPFNDKYALLVTTDMLIEDQHFLKKKISPYELGYKSLAVNLSDIAAMGGTPENAFLSLGIPVTTEIKWLDEFFRGLKYLADKSKTLLLGGDISKSDNKLIINIAVTGKADKSKIKKRNTAKPGDIICVTDFVGDSGGGLKALLNNLPLNKDIKYLVSRHYLPVPSINEGKWFAELPGVHAMIDVSDGIESDIHRILESSDVGAEIDLDKIPVSETLLKVTEKYNWNKYEIAVNGGEDYCLMLTVENHQFEYVKNNFSTLFSKPLFPIGEITDNRGNLTFKLNNKKIDFSKHGFDHFKNN